MKIKIAICDDDPKAIAVVLGSAEAVFTDYGFQAVFSRFSSGEALVQAMEHAAFDLVMLDINMPGMDGIAVGEQIRSKRIKTQIIYVSGCEERVFDALPLQPLGFVRKKSFLKDLEPAIALFLGTFLGSTAGELELVTRGGSVAVDTKKIRYIEGCRNYQLVYLDGQPEPIEIKMTMDKLEAKTENQGFLRIHRGFLVNHRCIRQLTYDDVLLADGTRLPVGQSKARAVRQQFFDLKEAL